MTVKELIEALQELPPDAPVTIPGDPGDKFYEKENAAPYMPVRRARRTTLYDEVADPYPPQGSGFDAVVLSW